MGDRAIDYEDYVQNFILHIDSASDDRCSICFEPATGNSQHIITTQCYHPGILYHEHCLLQWFRPDHANPERDNNSCPVCRKALWIPDQDEGDMEDEVDPAVVNRFTGVDMNDANDLTSLSKAARMMHYYAMLHAPTHLPELVHLIRRGILTSRLMDIWSEDVEPEDWSALLADLRACRTEVRGLDYNTVSFLEELPHTAEEVWDYATQPALMYSTDVPVTKSSSILTTYYKDDSKFSVIKQIKYTLREGPNLMAGYSSKVNVNIFVRAWGAKFVLELEDLDAILGFTISYEDHEIDIRLVDGCRIGLRY